MIEVTPSWSDRPVMVEPYGVMTATDDRRPATAGTTCLDTSVLLDLEFLYTRGLSALPASRAATARRVRWFLMSMHHLGDIASSWGAVESAWDRHTGTIDPARYMRVAGLIIDLANAPDDKMRAAFDGDAISFDPASSVDPDRSDFASSIWTRVIPPYMVLRETWWAIANRPTLDARLDHIGHFISEEMRFLPGRAALLALILVMGNHAATSCVRGLLHFDGAATSRDDPKVMHSVRSASWDLFFAHIVEFLESGGDAGGFASPYILLTGDKRLAQLQDLTRWRGRNEPGFGEHEIVFEELFAGAHADRAHAWLRDQNDALMARADQGRASLVADRNGMLDFAADYLSRTGDTSWAGLVADGPDCARDDLIGD